MTLEISTQALSDTRAHAEESYPEECCGLLAAKDGRVVGSLRLRNAYAGSKGDRYSIDPLVLDREDRAFAARGLVVTGVYHSHPDWPALLSRFDLDHSFPWYSYLIISVVNGRAADARAWLSSDGSTLEEQEIHEVA